MKYLLPAVAPAAPIQFNLLPRTVPGTDDRQKISTGNKVDSAHLCHSQDTQSFFK